MTNTGGEPNATGGRNYGPVGGSFSIGTPAFQQTTAQVNQLASSLTTLNLALNKLQSAAPGITTALTNITKSLTSMSSVAGSGGVTTYGSQGASVTNLASSLFGPGNQGVLHDIALFPARYMNTQIQNNRNVVNTSGQVLGSQSFASGMNLQSILGSLSKQLGGVMGGNPADILNLMDIGRQAGARIDWRGYTGTTGQQASGTANAPRAAGFLEAVRQGQIISPGTDVGTIAQSVGGFLANTGAQQQGAFLTGGAFSMVGAGNSAKSISQWAEGILKWFMNQRPGNKRGKPFDYGELMSQNFPGSNMDAWFQANGVPQDMREYWWSYALGKASQTGSTGGAAILGQGSAVPQQTQQNPIYQRLAAGNVTTRQSFNLGGKLTGMYGNMEQSNQWFNDLLSQMLGSVLPGALSQGGLSWMQYLPDEIRDLLMSGAENTKVGALGAGVLGWGSLLNNGLGKGDVGDVGEYGPNGTSGTAGMHPDMRKRINAMMRANPNLSITSGHRDLAKQQTLRRKGVGRVSGRPSAHTRGMAADLGPSSQYGWISKNASRFGLKSGRSAGEPWHVGMGDTPDTTTGVVDTAKGLIAGLGGQVEDSAGLAGMLQGLLSSFSGAFAAGVDPDTQMKGIAQGASTLLKAMLSIFASPTTNMDNLQFRDVYGSLTKYTQGFFASGMSGLPSLNASANLGPVGSSGTLSPDMVTRAKTAATALHAAGFSGDDLFKILAISGRESGWDPSRKNPNTSDRGLMQMNWSANKDWLIAGHFASSEDELLDINRNARAAYNLWHVRGHDDWTPWKGSDSSPWAVPKGGPGWDRNGDEMWRTESQQPIAREAMKELNLGDMDYAGPTTRTSGGTGSRLTFNNTFQLGGTGGANGGIDVKRAANQIADVLEDQMKQRMSRYN